MTREEAKQLLPIIQAFSEGKCIQTKTGSGWVNMENMSFSGKPKAYRIKPDPKYRQFKDAEECWKEMQKHHPFGWVKNQGLYKNIANVMICSITFADNEARDISYEQAFKNYTFADGTPFAQIQQASAKLRNVFVKALLWC